MVGKLTFDKTDATSNYASLLSLLDSGEVKNSDLKKLLPKNDDPFSDSNSVDAKNGTRNDFLKAHLSSFSDFQKGENGSIGGAVYRARKTSLKEGLDLNTDEEMKGFMEAAEKLATAKTKEDLAKAQTEFTAAAMKQLKGSFAGNPTQAIEKMLQKVGRYGGDEKTLRAAAQMYKSLMNEANRDPKAKEFQKEWKKELTNRKEFQDVLNAIGKGEKDLSALGKWKDDMANYIKHTSQSDKPEAKEVMKKLAGAFGTTVEDLAKAKEADINKFYDKGSPRDNKNLPAPPNEPPPKKPADETSAPPGK